MKSKIETLNSSFEQIRLRWPLKILKITVKMSLVKKARPIQHFLLSFFYIKLKTIGKIFFFPRKIQLMKSRDNLFNEKKMEDASKKQIWKCLVGGTKGFQSGAEAASTSLKLYVQVYRKLELAGRVRVNPDFSRVYTCACIAARFWRKPTS